MMTPTQKLEKAPKADAFTQLLTVIKEMVQTASDKMRIAEAEAEDGLESCNAREQDGK